MPMSVKTVTSQVQGRTRVLRKTSLTPPCLKKNNLSPASSLGDINNFLDDAPQLAKDAPKKYDIKDPAFEKHNHLEQIDLRYEKITWTYKGGNIIHSDSWNERNTA